MTRIRGILLTAVVVGLVSTGSLFAQRYFPLDPGNSWVYVNDQFSGEHVNSVLDVDENGIASYTRGNPENVLRLEEFGSEINIEFDEGLVPFYLFSVESFRHNDTDGCLHNRDATVTMEREPVVTPAGTFADCLRIDYGPSICADAGVISEWFAPDVGLVQWVDNTFVGPRRYQLSSFSNEFGVRFQRGEVNLDGSLDIGDPVYILTWLFRSGPEPTCVSAADLTDDDTTDISDPVYLLTYLFLGGLPPAPPFGECGYDRTTDEALTCEEYLPCLED